MISNGKRPEDTAIKARSDQGLSNAPLPQSKPRQILRRAVVLAVNVALNLSIHQKESLFYVYYKHKNATFRSLIEGFYNFRDKHVRAIYSLKIVRPDQLSAIIGCSMH